MHIKRITIQGFKTYKETTAIDFLSPKTNVVVGRNGSGKSNFFAAIRFVLSDAYTQMSREERQGLIHEGSGTVMSAYAEIVFSNDDSRFPIDSDEVVIRRTIGLKKDDYSVNSKSAQRSEVMNLLESAGFSRSNPYYIVPQGRITALTNAKDSERLSLLKEVAGAKVFEQKLKQSRKEMAQAQNQREKIDEMLEFIAERLDDLSSEKDDLVKYQELEKEKKFIEYSLYDREQQDLTQQIANMEEQHAQELDGSSNYVSELNKRSSAENQIEEVLVELVSKRNVLKTDCAQISEDLMALQQDLATQNVITSELKEQSQSAMEQLKIAKEKQELNETKKNEALQKLQTIEEELENCFEKESNLKNELSELKTKQKDIYMKLERDTKYKTREERNEHIQKQLEHLQQKLLSKRSEFDDQEARKQQLQQQLSSVEKDIHSIEEKLNGEESKAAVSEQFSAVQAAKSKLSELVDARKQCWRDEARQKVLLETASEEKTRASRQVGELMDRSLGQGISSVIRIANMLGLRGVYGTLGELVEVNPKYKTAAESVAGNALFHIVVDNDSTAATLMEELVREKSGRVTFMPLNRIQASNVKLPERKDCVPLIKKLAFDDSVALAVKQVWGHTVVAANLQVASEVSREYHLTSVTLDGDKAESRGVLSGGSRDFQRSRFDVLAVQRRRREELAEIEKELHELKRKNERLDLQVTEASNQVTNEQDKYDSLLNKRESLKTHLYTLNNERTSIESMLHDLTTINESATRAIRDYEQQIHNCEEELATDFKNGAHVMETKELQTLVHKIGELETELTSCIKRKNSLELELLQVKQESEQISIEAVEPELEFSTQELEIAEKKLSYLNEQVVAMAEKKASLEKELENVKQEIADKERVMAKLADSKSNLDKKLTTYQKNWQKSVSKKQLIVLRRDEVQKKIRDLGVLPEEAFSKFSDLSSEDLLRKLNSVTKKLKKFNHVNKKAMEQFANFSKQRDVLFERRKESDNSKESIEQLITVLEQRKYEAISRTFDQLASSFEYIFEQLVPQGIGKLLIERRESQEEVLNMTQQPENGSDSAEDYIGVSMSVSFNSKNDEQQRIEQLSGGQKSLCAIALILAIQKCDPAPFYLFDEIDANLDTQYRAAVAQLISRLSGKAQFICTTFRPELLDVASKFYGISYSNKISSVAEIPKERALEFVEGQKV